MPTNYPLLNGQKFGHLTVISLHHQDKRWRRHYLCRCRCGAEKTVQASLLKSGNTKSCGCLVREVARLRVLPHGIASRNQVFAGYRHKAGKAKIGFSLTAEQFSRIAVRNCFYCGAEPANVHKSPHGTGDFVYNGIDRIECRRGYTIANTVAACPVCNFAKSDHNQGLFLAWIKRAHDHLTKTGIIKP